MKYFKITDLTQDEEFYISSTMSNETPGHLALTLHLDTEKQYKIEEVSADEFYRETEEDDFFDPPSLPSRDTECEGDWDWEDDDEYLD